MGLAGALQTASWPPIVSGLYQTWTQPVATSRAALSWGAHTVAGREEGESLELAPRLGLKLGAGAEAHLRRRTASRF